MLLLLNDIELLISIASEWINNNSTIVEAIATIVSTTAAIIALHQSSRSTKISNKQSIFEKRLAAYSIVSSLCETYQGYKDNKKDLPSNLPESEKFDQLTRAPIFYEVRSLRHSSDDAVVVARKMLRQKLVEDLAVITRNIKDTSLQGRHDDSAKTIYEDCENAKLIAEMFNALESCEDVNLPLTTLRPAEELMMCVREIDMLWHRKWRLVFVPELSLENIVAASKDAGQRYRNVWQSFVSCTNRALNKFKVKICKKNENQHPVIKRNAIDKGNSAELQKAITKFPRLKIKKKHANYVESAREFVECYARVVSNLSFVADYKRRIVLKLPISNRLMNEYIKRQQQLKDDEAALEYYHNRLEGKKQHRHKLKDDIRL